MSSNKKHPFRCCVNGNFHHFTKSTMYYLLEKHNVFMFSDKDEKEFQKGFHIAFYWSNRIKQNKNGAEYRRLLAKGKVINFFLKNTTKTFVANSFEKFFGYNLAIDPMEHNGWCVLKDDLNGSKTCSFLKCPILKEDIMPHTAYQKVIHYDSTENKDHIHELRVPIIGRIIPYIFFKTRRRGLRFTSKNLKVEIRKPLDYFSEDELIQIIKYCKSINFEYGELDILRSDEDGLIYIIDVNNSPWWPPNRLGDRDRQIALNMLWNAFIEEYFGDYYKILRVKNEDIDDCDRHDNPISNKKYYDYEEYKFKAFIEKLNTNELRKEYVKKIKRKLRK